MSTELDHGVLRESNGMLVGPDAEDVYWGEIEQPQFQDLLGQIDRKRDFYTAVLNFFADHPRKDLYPYITDVHGRGAWHRFIQKTAGNVAIDLGAGMGGISEYLTREYERVYAIEGCPDRCRMLALRKELNHLENLKVIHNSIYKLPFRDGCADLVASNGVLEWAALNRPGKVWDIQLEFLKEINRTLNDDGILYVGIENRFARVYFKGKSKDHSGLYRTSLVPRWLAGLMCARAQGGSMFSVLSRYGAYRTHTYSLAGYRKLFRAAGFKYLHFVCAEPSYDLTRFGFSIGTPLSQLAQFAEVYGLPDLTKWIRRYLCTNFLIFASRRPLENRIVQHPMYFGYMDDMHLDETTIHRTDVRGERSREEIINGKTLVKAPEAGLETQDLIDAYENTDFARRGISRREDFDRSWHRILPLLSQHLDGATLARLRQQIIQKHLDKPYHGDFWLGNLMRDTRTSKLVLIDPERYAFGSRDLDIADFVLDVVMNDRAAAFPRISVEQLCNHFGVQSGDRDLFAIAVIRQILRYSPFHRSHALVYRFLTLLDRWRDDSAVNLLRAA